MLIVSQCDTWQEGHWVYFSTLLLHMTYLKTDSEWHEVPSKFVLEGGPIQTWMAREF